MVTREQTNSLKPKIFASAITPTPTMEPCTYHQAVQHACWQQAMQAEYTTLMNNNTWSIVPCPPNINLVGCKWIFKIKRRPDGSIERHKARLVAQGFNQQAGIISLIHSARL